ncbi:v-SNARE, coiled-coil homology domain, partial [Dillenia turbinata]
MMDNIEKVLDRGERIELFLDQTENLQFQLSEAGEAAWRKMWFQNLRIKIIVGGTILALILVIWISACHGFK